MICQVPYFFTIHRLHAPPSRRIAAEDVVFAKNSEWEVVSTGHKFAEGMAWDTEGNFFFTDVPRNQLIRVDAKTGKKTLLDGDTGE